MKRRKLNSPICLDAFQVKIKTFSVIGKELQSGLRVKRTGNALESLPAAEANTLRLPRTVQTHAIISIPQFKTHNKLINSFR